MILFLLCLENKCCSCWKIYYCQPWRKKCEIGTFYPFFTCFWAYFSRKVEMKQNIWKWLIDFWDKLQLPTLKHPQLFPWSIFKALVKLCFNSAFNRLKFISFFLSIFLALSDIPNLDLNKMTNHLLKSTLIKLVYNSSGYCRY